MDMLDQLLRIIRSNSCAFGGIQVVMTGDFLQLPPVTDADCTFFGQQVRAMQDNGMMNKKYAFCADVWNELCLVPIILRKKYRFRDERYGMLLDNIRIASPTPDDIALLQSRLLDRPEVQQEYVRVTSEIGNIPEIYSKRMDVHYANARYLRDLQRAKGCEVIEYYTEYSKTKENECITRGEILSFSVGCRVMCLTNCWHANKIANGSTGTIESFGENHPDIHKPTIMVKFDNGVTQRVTYIRLHKTGSFTLPLAICYTTTIHKIQGKELERCVMKLDHSVFEANQAYVALSRVKSLGGLYLKSFHLDAIKMDPISLDYVQRLETKGLVTWKPLADDFIENAGPTSNMWIPRHNVVPSVGEKKQGQVFVKTVYTDRDYSNNIIYYDFETWDSRTHVDGETPYYCFMRYIDHDMKSHDSEWTLGENGCFNVARSTFNRILYLLIRNTLHLSSVKRNIRSLKGQVSKSDAKSKESLNRGKVFMKKLAEPLKVCAFNGSGFDFHWFLSYLIDLERVKIYYNEVSGDVRIGTTGGPCGPEGNGELESFKQFDFDELFSMKSLHRGRRIVSLCLYDKLNKRKALCTHDLHLILGVGSSLDRSVEDFCGEKIKSVFPHNYINRVGPACILSEEPVKLELSDFPEKDHKEVQKLVGEGQFSLESFPIRKHLKHYGSRDVIALQRLYDSVNEVCKQALGCSVFRFITSASMSVYGFFTKLPKECVDHAYDGKTKAMRKIGSIVNTASTEEVGSFFQKQQPDVRYQLAQQLYQGSTHYNVRSHISATEDSGNTRYRQVISKLYRLNMREATLIREAAYGGRTVPCNPTYTSSQYEDYLSGKISYDEVNDYLAYLDMSGMYSYAMKNYRYPYGPHRWLKEDELANRLAFLQKPGAWKELLENPNLPMFIAKVKVYPNPHNVIPAVARHEDAASKALREEEMVNNMFSSSSSFSSASGGVSSQQLCASSSGMDLSGYGIGDFLSEEFSSPTQELNGNVKEDVERAILHTLSRSDAAFPIFGIDEDGHQTHLNSDVHDHAYGHGHDQQNPEEDLYPHPVGHRPEKGGRTGTKWDLHARIAAYSSVDIMLMLMCGDVIESIEWMVEWTDSTYVFRDWIELCVRGKTEGEESGNKGKKIFWKLLANSTFGINLKRDFFSETSIMRSDGDIDEFLSNHTISDFWFGKNDSLCMKGERFMEDDETSCTTVYLGVFVLSYSRLMYHNIIEKINPHRFHGTMEGVKMQPYYGDTDSFFIHSSQLKYLEGCIQKENGYLTDDVYDKFDVDVQGNKIPVTANPYQFRWSKIIKYLGPAPKSYAIRCVMPPESKINAVNRNIHDVVKFKGIPKSNIVLHLQRDMDAIGESPHRCQEGTFVMF
jgi:ATP-dependent DNA helicase PIF1